MMELEVVKGFPKVLVNNLLCETSLRDK
jgi:hypothetical protein